jgi:threonine dehydrogenase-like Zn-dependent dehydrogenase
MALTGSRPVDSVLVASGGSASEQISMALKLVKFGRLAPSPLVTHVPHGWDSVDEGLDLMRSHDASVIKPVIPETESV